MAITMKLASKANTTRRTLRSGSEIWETVRPAPIASMLDTTKVSMATVAALLNSCVSMDVSLAGIQKGLVRPAQIWFHFRCKST